VRAGGKSPSALGKLALKVAGYKVDRVDALMGENFWPYGIAPNRKALEALFQYSYEQGLASRKLTIEELFHSSSLEFEDGKL
jgi:4,5-dihydroxyphthalate decarboxylase